jgi:tetratricopeptide (TPR) repeat protein
MQRTVLALCIAIAFTGFTVNAIAVAEDPQQSIQSILVEARDAQARRDFHAAAESYRKAAALEPSVPELWANLGLMDHESGNSAAAIRSFKEAIRLNPSLFVPQLFMGIELLQSRNPEAALSFLEDAEKLNPNDLQAALNLGKAYAMLDRADRAAEAYSKATWLAPNDANAWLSLGTEYLQQVEDDARLMVSGFGHSAYSNLRAAETFAEEGKLVQAESAYTAAIASGSPAPCTHAQFGIMLLRQKKTAEAGRQFELESSSGSHCGLAQLGRAVAELLQGDSASALQRLTSLSIADPAFVQLNLPLLRDAVSADQARSLVALARAGQIDAPPSIDVVSFIERAWLSSPTAIPIDSSDLGPRSKTSTPFSESAWRLFAAGRYAGCNDALRPALDAISADSLQLLASCSFYAGDYRTTSIAAQRLKMKAATLVQGLYWESKADQKLAVAGLIRASQIDADSPRMHVLLGDVFRQKRRWDEAEAEYRKAVALDTSSHGARLSLAIDLFSELKTDEALQIDKALLAEAPDDPEANLLAGEILVQRNQFKDAEPYLVKCEHLKPEFLPRKHALLGKVYASTDRIPAAISEYKAGLSTDEDGGLYYQLARLYQKSGNKNAADRTFAESQRLRRKWDERAHVALQQSSTDLSHE